MEKKPFVTLEQLKDIEKKYPTPFYIYDEKGIRENARRLKEAFSWNKGYKEYFAVKATPNPFILKILKEMGCGTDCSSMTELMMSKACGFAGHEIMFSSNDTPPEEFAYAQKLGAIINLDDITHIPCLEETLGFIPETISCRYNPGGVFKISNDIMDNPGEAKYGMTDRRQTAQPGVKHADRTLVQWAYLLMISLAKTLYYGSGQRTSKIWGNYPLFSMAFLPSICYNLFQNLSAQPRTDWGGVPWN